MQYMKAMLKYCLLGLMITAISCGGSGNKNREATKKTENGNGEQVVANSDERVILFFGNSLTAGMGLDPEEAFPSFIQDKLDSLGYNYTVVNAGLSGETTASGRNRLPWVLTQDVAVFVLELGANDGLRGIPLEETRSNLQAMIDQVQEENPGTPIILAGMQIPPNMGPEYTSDFRDIFPELADEYNIILIPFLLKDVGGVAELNQDDGIHPTREGHRIIANNIWPEIEKAIKMGDSIRESPTSGL
jgi:acyl-CoA thioesterase-1